MFGKICQSCGMPLARDEEGGGSNADGSLSSEYCSHCYQKGKFVHPNLNAQQMAERVKDKMREMKIPGFLAYFFTRNISKLKRWKDK